VNQAGWETVLENNKQAFLGGVCAAPAFRFGSSDDAYAGFNSLTSFS